MTDTLLARSDLDSLIGIGNRQVMKDNHRNHGRFIASMLSSFDPGLLVETILWVFRAYRSRGFEAKYWPVQLEAWLEAIKANLSTESSDEIERLYMFMLNNTPGFTAITDSPLTLDPRSNR